MKGSLTQSILVCIAILSLYIMIQTLNMTVGHSNTEVIALVVKATVAAWPTPMPHVVTKQVEVPIVVEVTRIVNQPPQTVDTITDMAAIPTPAPTATLVQHSTPLGQQAIGQENKPFNCCIGAGNPCPTHRSTCCS